MAETSKEATKAEAVPETAPSGKPTEDPGPPCVGSTDDGKPCGKLKCKDHLPVEDLALKLKPSPFMLAGAKTLKGWAIGKLLTQKQFEAGIAEFGGIRMSHSTLAHELKDTEEKKKAAAKADSTK